MSGFVGSVKMLLLTILMWSSEHPGLLVYIGKINMFPPVTKAGVRVALFAL